MKVAYLGPKGSFTHSATLAYYDQGDLQPFPTIPACIKAVSEGLVEVAVVPIENTIEGTVNPTLDYLYHKVDLAVVGEIVMPIAQQLLVKATTFDSLSTIEKVYSHPQALAQCQEYLAEKLPNAQTFATDSTSLAAKLVADSQSGTIAAIGPVASGKEYQLQIMEENIQDIPHNKTRFWLISQRPLVAQTSGQAVKASLCFTMPNNLPGALQKALTTFSWRDLNLNKIESRPLKTTLGDYFFLTDIMLNQEQLPLVANAIAEIELLGGEVKQLGIYPVSEISGI